MNLTWKRKMHESLCCYLILLVASLSGLSSGTELASESVCEGDSIQLFQNVKLSKDNPVNVYINGQKQELIGTWFSTGDSSRLPKYTEKMFADEYGTIWIRNIELWNEGKYVLSYESDASNVKSQVLIHVLVAPTSFCKPKIKKMDNLLIASLDLKNCGRPSAHVHWLEHPDISYMGDGIVKLLPDKEAGTYYVCVESPALECVKALKISDYCTNFTVEAFGITVEVASQGKEGEIGKDKDVPRQGKEVEIGRDKDVPSQGKEVEIGGTKDVPNQGKEDHNGRGKDSSPPVSSETSELMKVVYMMAALVVSIVIAVTIVLIILQLHRRKKRSDAKASVQEMIQHRDAMELYNLMGSRREYHLDTDDNKSMKSNGHMISENSLRL